VAKTYESLAEKPQTIIWIMKNTCCVCWNRKYISGRNNRIQRGIRQAGFPVIKTIESFDFLPYLL